MNDLKNGFSLIELLIILGILSLLAGISVPLVHDFMLQQRASSQINQLLLAIHYTRNEAVLLGKGVTLCGSSDRTQCDGQWRKGYLVFEDLDSNGKIENLEQILRYFESFEPEDAIEWSAFPNVDYLKMAGTGFTQDQNGTFYYCPKEGDARYARAIIVDQAGRARLSQDQDGDGIHENANGESLGCNGGT